MKKLLGRFIALRYALAAVLSWLIDNGLYFLFLHFVFGGLSALGDMGVSTLSQVCARIPSSFFNFNANNYFVFRSEEKYLKALLKYYALCIPQALVTVLLLNVVIVNFKPGNDLLQTGLKIVVEAIIMLASFLIQKLWVFRK